MRPCSPLAVDAPKTHRVTSSPGRSREPRLGAHQLLGPGPSPLAQRPRSPGAALRARRARPSGDHRMHAAASRPRLRGTMSSRIPASMYRWRCSRGAAATPHSIIPPQPIPSISAGHAAEADFLEPDTVANRPSSRPSIRWNSHSGRCRSSSAPCSRPTGSSNSRPPRPGQRGEPHVVLQVQVVVLVHAGRPGPRDYAARGASSVRDRSRCLPASPAPPNCGRATASSPTVSKRRSPNGSTP